MLTLKGTGASDGFAMGRVYIYKKPELQIPDYKINSEDVENEIAKYNSAVEKSVNQISGLAKSAAESMGSSAAGIFHAHLEIADDEALKESVLFKISSEYKNVLLAVKESADELCEMFAGVEDEYFRDRVYDVQDVCERIMYNLAEVELKTLQFLPEKVIVVAQDLTPSVTATMDKQKVLAFITEAGGSTSHSAIMARTLEIPAVVGLGNDLNIVKDGETVIVDGKAGLVLVNPDGSASKEYESKKALYAKEKTELMRFLDKQTITTDGRQVELFANIGDTKDVEAVAELNGEGIGLFRTEFLYMNADRFPEEEEQFNAYKKVAEKMAGKTVIIRTLDIGGDKTLPYFTFPNEMNPFLGYRAIRMCLDKPEVFKTQLRAILRASVFGKIKIMLPMIISMDEIKAAKELINECKSELTTKGIPFDMNIETGIMIETPAAVWMADVFVKEVDFFSIGTNDLTQYTLAVDRGNESISSLFNSYNPAVIRSIKAVIDAAHKEGKYVGMCGEFASDELAVPLLLGLGLDEFSVSASSLLKVKKIICGSNYKKAQELAENALSKTDSSQVEELLLTFRLCYM